MDFASQKMEVFRQAWTYMRDGFYDDKFHGADWGEVRAQYAPTIAGVADPGRNSSAAEPHGGRAERVASGGVGRHGGGAGPASAMGGSACVRSRRVRMRGTPAGDRGASPLGPAAITKQVQVGRLPAGGGRHAVGAGTNLDEQLMQQGRTTRIELRVSASAGRRRTARDGRRAARSQPARRRTLLYREWVESNRAYVEKVSGGRLGYVHMHDMSEGALRQLYAGPRCRQSRQGRRRRRRPQQQRRLRERVCASTCWRGAAT